MEKQFKNQLSIHGSKNLLKAIEKELIQIGYELNKTNDYEWTYKANTLLINSKGGQGSGYMEYHNHDGKPDFILELPKDWNKCIELAKETIEEELKPGDWVRVLDTSNVRIKWNCPEAIGFVFKIDKETYSQYWSKGREGASIPNKYIINYLPSDLQKISKEEAEEHILKQAIEESGLKVGDILNTKILTKWGESGINYYDGSWQKDETGEDYYDERCIAKFDIKEGIPAFLVSDTIDIWLRLEGFSKFAKEYQEQLITIGEYETEVLNGKLKWGCQQISVEELQVVKKLLNSEISANITIHGTKIDKTLIEKLEKLLQNG